MIQTLAIDQELNFYPRSQLSEVAMALFRRENKTFRTRTVGKYRLYTS